MPLAQRLVDGPSENLLTEIETARYLKISPATLQRLIDKGRFPKAVEITDQTRLWMWSDVLWYCVGAGLRHRIKSVELNGTATEIKQSPPPE